MRRYIDADEALRMIQNSKQDNPCESSYKGIWNTAHECCISCVDAVPTADVVEVRHGEWVEQIRDYGEYMATEGFKCSVCGYETMDNDKKYCSECGAKMDSERSENGT